MRKRTKMETRRKRENRNPAWVRGGAKIASTRFNHWDIGMCPCVPRCRPVGDPQDEASRALRPRDVSGPERIELGAEADEGRCVGGGPRLVHRSGRWWFGRVRKLGVGREGCTVSAMTAGETRVFANGPGFVVGADGPRREPVIPAGGCDWPFFVCRLEQGKIAAAALPFAMAHSYCVWAIWDLLHKAWNDIKVADRATILVWRCPLVICFNRRISSHQPHREFIHWASSGDLVMPVVVVVVVVCVVQMMIFWKLNYQPFGSSGFLRYQKDLLAGFMQQAMQHMVLVLVPPTQ